MEYRYLGASGLQVPVLSFGAATFGGSGRFFSAFGDTDVEQASRLIDICLEAGVNLFDAADVYSDGACEEVLGGAIKGRREKLIITTKMSLALGPGPNESGSSRLRLHRGVEGALKRLDTDYIDVLQLHGFDGHTPIEEVLSTMDALVRDGKVRYVGVSNFTGWQLMKSLGIADAHGWPRYISHQVHYSLLTRDYEWDLMPLAHDQNVGAMVWSPLAWGRLAGKVRRDQPAPEGSRLGQVAHWGLPVDEELMFNVIDVLDEIAAETGKSLAQISLNWLLQRPTVATVILGARNEEQLRDNLGAVGWSLTPEQVQRLDEVSATRPPYPYLSYYIDRSFQRLNPPLTVARGRK
ncbi:aldo/keto reductase [Mangrovimicrobium sediminis]|uniref:Aldo/keto reductase n=2 Tax=Mangrovimicrobium sediminis TaxID=2562682 RepID=A0A4Z0LVX6_9GAMM|nr:aldo/keto reductase [Haliea sp. SAOS-164]